MKKINQHTLLVVGTGLIMMSPCPVLAAYNQGSSTQQDHSQMTLEGEVIPILVSLVVPSELSFEIDTRLEAGQQFIAADFSLINDSNAPLAVSLSEFSQKTTYFTDVLGDRYTDEDWVKLGSSDSKQLALGLALNPSNAWVSPPNSDILYAKHIQEAVSPVPLGMIKPHEEVFLTFKAKHGSSFKEVVKPEYQLTFIFNLIA